MNLIKGKKYRLHNNLTSFLHNTFFTVTCSLSSFDIYDNDVSIQYHLTNNNIIALVCKKISCFSCIFNDATGRIQEYCKEYTCKKFAISIN